MAIPSRTLSLSANESGPGGGGGDFFVFDFPPFKVLRVNTLSRREVRATGVAAPPAARTGPGSACTSAGGSADPGTGGEGDRETAGPPPEPPPPSSTVNPVAHPFIKPRALVTATRSGSASSPGSAAASRSWVCIASMRLQLNELHGPHATAFAQPALEPKWLRIEVGF